MGAGAYATGTGAASAEELQAALPGTGTDMDRRSNALSQGGTKPLSGQTDLAARVDELAAALEPSAEQRKQEGDWKRYRVVGGTGGWKDCIIYETPYSNTVIGTLEPGKTVYASPEIKAVDNDGIQMLRLMEGGAVEMILLTSEDEIERAILAC